MIVLGECRSSMEVEGSKKHILQFFLEHDAGADRRQPDIDRVIAVYMDSRATARRCRDCADIIAARPEMIETEQEMGRPIFRETRGRSSSPTIR